MIAQERWLPVVGYEGIYEVSNQGRVRSLDRLDCRNRRIRGRTLSPEVNHAGYLRVFLFRDGRGRHIFVHRLVLSAFVGEGAVDHQVCHADGNPQNNDVNNLRWDTATANARDQKRHGTNASSRRTHCPQGHEYDEANTYVRKQGWRMCRACLGERHTQHKTRQKAA